MATVKKRRDIKIPAWMGILGLLGFLGLLPGDAHNSQYFFFIFFGFFGWYFWSKLMGQKEDERLLENQRRAAQVMCTLFCLLAFLLLFALSKGVPGSTVLLAGSLGCGLCMILSPALILYFDRVAD